MVRTMVKEGGVSCDGDNEYVDDDDDSRHTVVAMVQ